MPYSPPAPNVRMIPAGRCALCGVGPQDLRPYGPKGATICIRCGLKDWKQTKLRMRERLWLKLTRHLRPGAPGRN
jgi:hypothetical protein